jgi:hypothetical protein
MRSSGCQPEAAIRCLLSGAAPPPNLLAAAHWPAESAPVAATSAEPTVSGRHQKHAVHTQGVVGLDTTDLASKLPVAVKEP